MTLLSEHAGNATAAPHQILRSPGDFDSKRAEGRVIREEQDGLRIFLDLRVAEALKGLLTQLES
jgi:hypothetical protein